MLYQPKQIQPDIQSMPENRTYGLLTLSKTPCLLAKHTHHHNIRRWALRVMLWVVAMNCNSLVAAINWHRMWLGDLMHAHVVDFGYRGYLIVDSTH